MNRWFARREVLLPTFRGWVLILALLALIGFSAMHQVHRFLSVDHPAEKATVLVVEGWLSEPALDKAVSRFREASYDMVVTTGGPIESWADIQGFSSFADRAADYLARRGIPAEIVHSVPAPASAQNRTFLSAVALRSWLEQQKLASPDIDLLSGGVHARRSHRLFRLALGPNYRVGILSADPSGYDPAAWWRSSEGAKAVMGELISLAWTVCCFRVPEPGSHEELWGRPVLRSEQRTAE